MRQGSLRLRFGKHFVFCLDPQILACGGGEVRRRRCPSTDGKEVIYMIDYEKNLRVDISEVVEVIVDPIKTYDELGYSQRMITVRTKTGETFTLNLSALQADEIEFRDRVEIDWLNPKVYKPKR